MNFLPLIIPRPRQREFSSLAGAFRPDRQFHPPDPRSNLSPPRIPSFPVRPAIPHHCRHRVVLKILQLQDFPSPLPLILSSSNLVPLNPTL
jgi:hypothetical protein